MVSRFAYHPHACAACIFLAFASYAHAQSAAAPCMTPSLAREIVRAFDADILQMTRWQLAYDATNEAELRKLADQYQARQQLTSKERAIQFERVVASPEFQAAGANKQSVLNAYDAQVQEVRRYRAAGNTKAACEAGVSAKTYLQLAHTFSDIQYSMLRARLNSIIKSK